MSWDDWRDIPSEDIPSFTASLLVSVAVAAVAFLLVAGLLVGCVGLAFGAPIYVDGAIHGELEQCDATVERLECVTVRRNAPRPTPTATPISCPPGEVWSCGFRCQCVPRRTATPIPAPTSTGSFFAAPLEGSWFYSSGPQLAGATTAWGVYSRVSPQMARIGQPRLAPEVFWAGIQAWNAPPQDIDGMIDRFALHLDGLCPGEHCPTGVVIAEPSSFSDAECLRRWGQCASLPEAHAYALRQVVALDLEPAVVPFTFRWAEPRRSRLDPVEIWLQWIELDGWLRRLRQEWPQIKRSPIQLSNGTVPDDPNRERQLSLLAWGMTVIQQRYGYPPELQIELGRVERNWAAEWDCEAYRAAKSTGAAISVFDHSRLQQLAKSSGFPC